MSKTWFVAGAAGGLGRHLVGAALAAGHDVLAADIDADGLRELNAGYSPHPLPTTAPTQQDRKKTAS